VSEHDELVGWRLPAVETVTFEEFVTTRSTGLLRVAYLLTGDRHAAEDLLQGVLERMYVRWRRIAGDPEAYARRALTNAAANRWRVRSRRPETPLLPEHDRGRPDRADGIVEADAVVRALRSVPVRQRAVVVLRYLEDLSEEETARLLGVTPGTVKSQASKGLARLRAALAGQSPGRDRAATSPSLPAPATMRSSR
jgi:RNA polymerase sigma-70 factor (sigma-E family)